VSPPTAPASSTSATWDEDGVDELFLSFLEQPRRRATR